MSPGSVSNFYRMTTRDPDYDSDDEYRYECLWCGTLVSAVSHPGDCSDCGTAFRNRRMPYE